MISATPAATDEEIAAMAAAIAALRGKHRKQDVRASAWRRAMRVESVEPFER
ncbi:MAG TPA: hypothetical protein VFE17_12870 [Candidatus Baltobacteraceae bacterium]|jgi:hypothetical protein|nr:hypothetical protein [Candidatus Baltobacteraceae bacterium]